MAAPEDQSLRFRSGFTGDLGSKLHEAALEGEGTDVEISFGGTSTNKVHAHSVVLQVESKVFKVMLCEQWKTEKKPENGKTTINLPEDKYADFVLFLQLLYGFQDLTVTNFNLVLPAYKLVDKYAVLSALRLCDEYFDFLIDNMDKLDAAKLLWMAKDNQIDVLYEAAMEYVKTNLQSVWIIDQFNQRPYPHQSWMDWDEETLIEIISTDGLKVIANEEHDKFNWNLNEYEIAHFTAMWLHCKRYSPKSPIGTWARDYNSSHRLFSKIRFMQMENELFQKCVRELLAGRLPKGYISDITVAYFGGGEEQEGYKKESGFEVDKRLRNI